MARDMDQRDREIKELVLSGKDMWDISEIIDKKYTTRSKRGSRNIVIKIGTKIRTQRIYELFNSGLEPLEIKEVIDGEFGEYFRIEANYIRLIITRAAKSGVLENGKSLEIEKRDKRIEELIKSGADISNIVSKIKKEFPNKKTSYRIVDHIGTKLRRERLYDLVKEGYNSTQIAAKLSEEFGEWFKLEARYIDMIRTNAMKNGNFDDDIVNGIIEEKILILQLRAEKKVKDSMAALNKSSIDLQSVGNEELEDKAELC